MHVELEKSCFTCIISFHFIFPTQSGVVFWMSGHWGLRRLSKVPRVTKLLRIQTRSHLTLEPLIDTLVIFTILCAKYFPRILIKNTDSCTSFSKVLIQPIYGRAQRSAFKSTHPRDFEAGGHTEHNLQSTALYFLDVLLGRELPCISKALQNEGLAANNKDISHLDGPRSPGSLWNPSRALGESEEEPTTAEQVHQSRGLLGYQTDAEAR